ncbi:hypothetical protein SCMU_06620 [Sinomonas cyclohexanicum]|uniref:Sulfite oxidase n=1 Tax=Sinomonas cyclohexanicum TaxID=322009 RepID=A0ABN6FCZ6_SINCY|nr:sulfite oxidase [Corynebacterium cyclohexanicum]BCT74820.1 hypothetical protein SCMU_06620 [Corynebacterium cyclohexanicum]
MRAKISTPHRPHRHEPLRPGPEQAAPPAPEQYPPRAPTTGPVTDEELELGRRNHSAPLEALQWPLTPPGLHYTVVHFDIPDVQPETWRLRVHGAVEHPLELTLSDLQRRPRRTATVTLECAGNGRGRLDPRPQSVPWDTGAFGTAEWTGTPLAPILEEAGLAPEAVELVFTGADRGVQGGLEQDYARSLPVAVALEGDLILAYEMAGAPLPPQHGYPLRLLVPGWYGMASVKWLTAIDAVTEPAHLFQNEGTYRYSQSAEDPGEPVTRQRVRSLLIPPGIPDFFTRRRTVDAGPTMLRGRAWSGTGPVRRVEVGIDGHWMEAHVEPPPGPHAWQEFSAAWVADPGPHTLACRATDSAGNIQPLAQDWTYQGMGNNAVQEVAVEVRRSP